MKILALHASVNSHDNDAKGAFIPQAIRFAKARRAAGDTVELVPFDNSIANRAKRRDAFLELLGKAEQFDALAYFGHGLRTGLPSAAITMVDLSALVDRIHGKAAKNLRVVLYACSTAETMTGGTNGDGGLADRLRDQLSKAGHVGWIDAHTVPGHTTINRMTRRFYMDGAAEGTGGTWIIAPGSPEWKAWGDALHDDEAFRFGFPFMTESEIHARLARAA